MKRRTPGSWKAKTQPALVDFATLYKESVAALKALGPNPSWEGIASIEEKRGEKLEEFRKKYADVPLGASAFDLIYVGGPGGWPPSQRDMDQGLLENLYWKHYKEPLWIALQKAEQGDMNAYRRVTRICEQYQLRRFSQGPMKPAKGDPDHSDLLEMGLEMGLDKLSPEELADFFDAFCPCGKIHDADALKKQRLRTRKALRAIEAWMVEQRSKIPTRELMTVYGKGNLAAQAVRASDGNTPLVIVGEHQGIPPDDRILADCYIKRDGTIVILAGSKLSVRSAVRKIHAAFGVKTAVELFDMFFPG
jgi:hypothetical protein